ncbi:uncharacterized protein FTJAE_2235 [Fusarium tjaetaba]|uniref:Uncharacterized protein n=1 Tax=Fusarium tjaetaba TaxID=1567544 RepID=A0A8H5S2S3_9HYPO|nr:uncharacterized protein FTJAE_2235 [Fusarium tjaetaba]KAF5645805.1 hypothetical protein FTJAE_2235 [Fusarium tjaetaba]
MDSWRIICQCPNCNVEANHWAPCRCPYPSPPDEPSSTHASPNSVSYLDEEPTTSSPAAFEANQSASAPGEAVNFCCGEWSKHYHGSHPQMDYASLNVLIDSEPQETQPGDHIPHPTSGKSSKSASPSRTEDYLLTKEAKGMRSAAEELEDLRPADIFLVECMLNDMKWKSIYNKYNEIWEAENEGALRARMHRIKDKNPALRALLEQKI